MKPYAKLRIEIFAREMRQEDFARSVGMSLSAFKARLNARQPWYIDEIYRVMDLLELPYTAIPEYFPKDGRAAPKGCTQRFPDFTVNERGIAQTGS